MKIALGALSLSLTFCACGDPPPAPVPAPTLTAVELGSNGPYVANEDGALLAGHAMQLMALARLSDRTGQNVTDLAVWKTNAPNVATVSSGGLVQGVGQGIAQVSATYQGLTGSLGIVVALPQ